MIEVHLSFDGKLFLLNSQFLIETFLADDLNVHIVLANSVLRADSLQSFDDFLTDCRLKHS